MIEKICFFLLKSPFQVVKDNQVYHNDFIKLDVL